MRIFVTGGTGVLGRILIRNLRDQGHAVIAPSRSGLDLFDRGAVMTAVRDADAVFHLATRIPPPYRIRDVNAWHMNDRLRADASRALVDAALDNDVATYVQPTVTFVYPPSASVDETTPIDEVPEFLRSALTAEAEAARFAGSGRRGVVLRLGLVDGPGTGNDLRNSSLGASLHVEDAGTALVDAREVPSGIYNVCRDDERVINSKFKNASGWYPLF